MDNNLNNLKKRALPKILIFTKKKTKIDLFEMISKNILFSNFGHLDKKRCFQRDLKKHFILEFYPRAKTMFSNIDIYGDIDKKTSFSK